MYRPTATGLVIHSHMVSLISINRSLMCIASPTVTAGPKFVNDRLRHLFDVGRR